MGIRGLLSFGLGCILLFAAATMASGQEYHRRDCPGSLNCFNYGYVDVSVTVHSHPVKRVRVASQVFAFCELEVSTDHIVADAKGKITSELNLRYPGEPVEITYMVVNPYQTREEAEKWRKKAMSSASFSDHIETTYMWTAYSGKCRP